MPRKEDAIRMCPSCRKVLLIPKNRNRCKPCYAEWYRLYRLEKKARASEVSNG